MRTAALVLAGALLLAGCGGGDDETAPATTSTTPCSDAAFRMQDEELYVAQATAQNAARSGIGPDELTVQLRQGIRALRDRIEEHPPCAGDLREIAALEAQALDGLEAAVDDLETVAPGEPVPEEVTAAIEVELARLQDAAGRLQAQG
jgi:hypothetical protein